MQSKSNSLQLKSLWLAIPLVVGVGCHDGGDRDREIDVVEPPVELTVEAVYDASANPPLLPFPNAVYAGEDGRLDMPLPEDSTPGDLGDAVVALNTLDGFSTAAPFYADFAEAIDAATLTAGDSVRLFEVVVDNEGLPTEVIAELQADEDYSVTVSVVMDSRLLVKPLRPLKGAANYLVGISNELRAQSGPRMAPSTNYADLRDGGQGSVDSLVDEAYLGELIQAQEALLAANGMTEGTIVSSFSFQTHAISDVLDGIDDTATARTVSLIRPMMTIGGVEQPLTTAPFRIIAAIFGLTPQGQSDVYTGVIDLPYYMNVPVGPMDDTVLDSFMRDAAGEPILGDASTLQSASVTVPVLVAIPNPSRDPSLIKPMNGWPVALYHHGIGVNRANMLLIADVLTSRGVAMVAIDQPLHGVTENDASQFPLDQFAAAGVDFYDGDNERHFNLDLDGDGEIDFAGTHFSSPRNRLTFRDNLRQSVSDLIYLARTIPAIELPDATGLAFDPDRIHFVSLSLGSLVGTILAGVNDDIHAFSLSAPGGGITKFSEGSPNSNADVLAAAAALGLEQGTQEFEDYLVLLTTIDGPGDPINYALTAGQNHPIHLTEIVGDGTPDNPPDQTIPNDVLDRGQYEGLVVETAPLAGTEPLIRSMNLNDLLDSAMNMEGLRVVGRFVQGDHQSQLNPSKALSPFAVPEVTQEIHLQTGTFIASDGESIEVGDSSLLEMNFMPAN